MPDIQYDVLLGVFQTYQLISESLDKIDDAFSQAQLSDGGPKPLKL